jgi:hypothetical protein
MKKILILMILFFSLLAPCLAGPVSFSLGSGLYNDPPEPRLKYPISDTAIVSQQTLEFSWWNDYIDTSGFILKIYQGYNMYADKLILKENLSGNINSFNVASKLFADGQTYTWSLVRVSFAGYKSDKSFNAFKVIKK